MKVRGHIKGQLFGYRELPTESGLWGVLLPRPGEKAVAHEPNAQDVIEHIDADRLVFANSERVGNRGFLLWLSIFMAAVFLFGAAANLSAPVPEQSHWSLLIIDGLLFVVLPLFSLAAVYINGRKTLPGSIVISRRQRKIYAWFDQQKQWIALDYDELTPATFVHRLVTTSGSATSYEFTLCQIKHGTREIELSVMPAPAQGTPKACGELWEFIRRYMDGDPKALPPVRLVPPLSPKAWMARADRETLRNQVDEQHRVVRRITSMYLVWWYGIVFYWAERARNWIERTAPQRPLPQELQKPAPTDTSVVYRTVPFTPLEKQAQAGTLAHMRRRWLVCGVLSTLLWGGIFCLLAAGIWVMR